MVSLHPLSKSLQGYLGKNIASTNNKLFSVVLLGILKQEVIWKNQIFEPTSKEKHQLYSLLRQSVNRLVALIAWKNM